MPNTGLSLLEDTRVLCPIGQVLELDPMAEPPGDAPLFRAALAEEQGKLDGISSLGLTQH